MIPRSTHIPMEVMCIFKPPHLFGHCFLCPWMTADLNYKTQEEKYI